MTDRLCPARRRVQELLAVREAGELDRDGRGELLDHLATCPTCRDEAVASDPSLLFLPLAGASAAREKDERGERTAAAGASLAHDVMVAVTLVRRERSLALARRRSVLRLAAGIALVAFLATWVVRTRTAPAPVLVESRSATPSAPRPDPPPPIEGVGSPAARVYQFTASGEPTVVFVVDRNADI